MILICLPYAGGASYIYSRWNKHTDESILVVPIELKGRGKRYGEAFYEDFEDAVNDIYNNIDDIIDKNDYAIFGHSMGSLLAYELYYKIERDNRKIPQHIFFSGCRAPGLGRLTNINCKLPDYEFMKQVVELGGTSDEIMNNKELMEIYVPILKSDISMYQNYRYIEKDNKINCDISVLYGRKDSITIDELRSWENQAGKSFNMYEFEGNHFFINDNKEEVINIINKVSGEREVEICRLNVDNHR
ncbi:thioesterase [Clostridium zeae]|uniref:Thioesterase n=1 Tax=Clostridium zeae TaxID=2759022 RepID=A0ABQ1E6E7_9CLOT|nr:thioesterase domain-containing protein [Clostridium zeae]GFZ30334.1 thioesterase [Clostridium zeae]